MQTKRFFFLAAAALLPSGAWAQDIYPAGYEPESHDVHSLGGLSDTAALQVEIFIMHYAL